MAIMLTSLLILAILILIFLYILARKEIKELHSIHADLKHDYLSKTVKHGQNWEQFMPFTKEFEKISNKENFSFLGKPIDGVSFDSDNIRFIEFKTGSSSLSQRQREIKRLVEEKRVSWHEIRI